MHPTIKPFNEVSITAIIPAYKRIGQTLETLKRIRACEPRPDEIIVHVDRNHAPCIEAVQQAFPDIKILTSSESVGPGGGRNKLIAEAKNQLIASFDDDSYPMDTDYFDRVLALCGQFPDAAILCATIYQPGETIAPAKATAQWVADFIGCGCIYRRKVFLNTSGYVPLRAAYGMEEVDLSLRLLANDQKILRTLWLRVYHDTRLQHHGEPQIVAASIANLALLAFLRYPVSMWPLGAAQCLNRIRWVATHGRINGILPGVWLIPAHLWSKRHLREPLRRATVRSFIRLRRNPVPIEQTPKSASPMEKNPSCPAENSETQSRASNVSGSKKPARELPKAVVCFSGSRDHYEVASALAEAGLLEKLVTDLYLAPGSLPFSRQLQRRCPKLFTRHHPQVPPSRVITPPGTMLDSLLMKSRLASRDRQIRLDRSLGRRARRESWQTQTALFSYSYYAADAFAEGDQRPPSRFLFQLHPHPATVRKIFQEEMLRVPKFAASLKWEHELGAPQAHFDRLCAESRLANGWVVASGYTAATLAENGVPRDQIHVVPYGVAFDQYPCRTSAPPATAPFRIIWVGSMTQRKGLSYFLQAVGALPQENLEVLICGHNAVDEQVIREHGIRSIRILKGLPTAALTAELRAADLFVLPSLAEGFGHAILEAMASGLPVLTTASTCAPDVMLDGQHGFIVPIRDSQALVERINWGRAHRSQLYQMGLAAAAQARQFTWERFRKGIVDAYRQMIDRNLAAGEKILA